MNRSLWAIVVMGFFAVVAMIVGMWITVTFFSETDRAKHVKMAAELKDRFAFENVQLRVIGGATSEHTIELEYDTRKYLSFDPPACQEEMRQVGLAAWEKYEPKRKLKAVHITRRETTGGGCFRSLKVSELTITEFPELPPEPLRKFR